MNPAFAALLFGATCIALSPIFVRVAEVGPTSSAFWRVALAIPVLWALCLLERPRTRLGAAEWKACACAGAAFTGDLAFWHWSIQYTSVANSTLLANLSSIFVTLVAWLFLRQRPSGIFVLGLALALGGVGLLVRTSVDFSPTALLGDALGVITAMFYAWYLLAVKGLRDGGVTALRVMAIISTITAALLLPLALYSGETFFPQSTQGWMKLAGLAWISHVAGQGLIAHALAHLPAAFSSVGLLLQPVMAGLFAWVLLSEPLVALQIAGGAVVLAGIYLARRGTSG
jgi:drug/metabolite transporter (DMT)-like permease